MVFPPVSVTATASTTASMTVPGEPSSRHRRSGLPSAEGHKGALSSVASDCMSYLPVITLRMLFQPLVDFQTDYNDELYVFPDESKCAPSLHSKTLAFFGLRYWSRMTAFM
jgi:hypothetical protein